MRIVENHLAPTIRILLGGPPQMGGRRKPDKICTILRTVCKNRVKSENPIHVQIYGA